jgi:hypothetical protein
MQLNFFNSIHQEFHCRISLLHRIEIWCWWRVGELAVGWASPVHSNTGLSAVIFRTKPKIILFIITFIPADIRVALFH